MRNLLCPSLLPLLLPKQPKTRTLETQAQLDPRGHSANAKLRRRKRLCTGMLSTLLSWRRQRAHWVAFWNVEWRQSSFSRFLKMKRKLRSGNRTQREPWSIVIYQKEQRKLPIMSCLCTHDASLERLSTLVWEEQRGSSEEKCGSIHGTPPNVEEIPADNVGRRPCHGGLASCRLNPKTTVSPSPRWMVFVQTTMGDTCSCPVGPVLSRHPMSKHKKTQLGLPYLALSSP